MDPPVPPLLTSLPTPCASASTSAVFSYAPEDKPVYTGTLPAAATGSSSHFDRSSPSHFAPPPPLQPKPSKLARLETQTDGYAQADVSSRGRTEDKSLEQLRSVTVGDVVAGAAPWEDGNDTQVVTWYSSDEEIGSEMHEGVVSPAGPRIGPEQVKMIARMRRLQLKDSISTSQPPDDISPSNGERFVDTACRKPVLERTEEDLRATWVGRMGEALAEIGLDDEWIPDAVRMRKRRRKVRIPELGPRRLAYRFGSLLPYSAGDVFDFTDEDNVQTTRAMTLEQDRILNAQDLPAPIKFIQRLHARFCLINPFEPVPERELACWQHYSPILHHHSLRPSLIAHLQALLQHRILSTSSFLQIVQSYDQQVLEIEDPEGKIVGYWEWREKQGLKDLINRERELRGTVDYDPQITTTHDSRDGGKFV